MKDYFENRTIVIATKHEKEKVIAPLLNHELKLNSFLPKDFDTDVFGTFSGEIERINNPIETARAKCLKALEISGHDLAISNEGSFNIHPTLLFAHADFETILILDKKNNFEFIHNEISTNTNFNGSEIKSYHDLTDFAEKAKFPSHALILRKHKHTNEEIYKGIHTIEELKDKFYYLLNKFGSVYAETDMRAMHNPTRMEVIKVALEKLILKIKTPCPNCEAPGFCATEYRAGLPCINCGAPTKSSLLQIYTCHLCEFKQEKKYPHGKQFEDPMYCDFCNP